MVLVDALCPSQQFFSHVGTISWVEPVLSSEDKCLTQGHNIMLPVRFEPGTL